MYLNICKIKHTGSDEPSAIIIFHTTYTKTISDRLFRFDKDQCSFHSYYIFVAVFGGMQSSRLNFFFGLAMGLTISLLLACLTSLTSLKKTVHQTSMIASDSFRSFLDSRSIMQVTKNTGDMHDLLDRNLRPVKPAMVDDTHYHHGKLKKRQNKDFQSRVRVKLSIA